MLNSVRFLIFFLFRNHHLPQCLIVFKTMGYPSYILLNQIHSDAGLFFLIFASSCMCYLYELLNGLN